MATYICDIDGTLADCEWRRHFIDTKDKPRPNWEGFFNAAAQDKPFPHMLQLLTDLVREVDVFEGYKFIGTPRNKIIYSTGRPERFRGLTDQWLSKHRFPDGKMYMRKDGDHRPDHIVKREILDLILVDGYAPIMAFDDRDAVVKMWREAGIPCAQVAEGNF